MVSRNYRGKKCEPRILHKAILQVSRIEKHLKHGKLIEYHTHRSLRKLLEHDLYPTKS